MEAQGTITISKVDSSDEQVNLTYSIKDVGTVDEAEKLKKKIDRLVREEGGQTTLDEVATPTPKST